MLIPEEVMAKYQCKVNRSSGLGRRPAMSWVDMTWPGGWTSPFRASGTSRVDAINISLALDRFFGVFTGEQHWVCC